MRWRRKDNPDREIRAHLDWDAQDRIEAGVPAQEAIDAARRDFGNPTLTIETCREASRWAWLARFLQDLRYVARILRKNPGFAFVVILVLALGIGANSAVFSVLHALLLKSLPVEDPDRLVVLTVAAANRPAGPQVNFAYPILEKLRERTPVFSGLLTHQPYQFTLSNGATSERVQAEVVSGGYFSTLGVQASRGRTFTEADNGRTPQAVAVVSHRFWQERLLADPHAVGRVVRLNALPVTIIGIAPEGFFGTDIAADPDFWLPIRLMNHLTLPGSMLDNPNATWLPAMARLSPGVTREQAQTIADTVYRQARQETYGSPGEQRLVLLPGSRGLSRLQTQFSTPLAVLMILAGLVLLTACANLANLMLARASVRRREIAVRLAIGASRGRLVRQFLTESIVIALLGGAFGLSLASFGVPAMLRVLPATRNLAVHSEAQVLAFSLAASILTGILFGLAPALQAGRTDLGSALKIDSASIGRRLSLRECLVVAQVAFSMLLLTGASLFVRTLEKLHAADAGFHGEDHVIQLSMNPEQVGYRAEQSVALYARVLNRIAEIPGVRSVTATQSALLSGNRGRMDFYPPGYRPKRGEDVFSIFEAIGPGYFEALGIPLLQGRDFQAGDLTKGPNVAILNQQMARYFFGAENPIGKAIGEEGKPAQTVIGVVGDIKYRNLRESPPRIFYLPLAPASSGGRTLYVRADGNPAAVMAEVRQAVQSVDLSVPIYGVKTLARQIDDSLAQERLTAWLSSSFGLLSLALAAIGLYGMVSYAVSRQTREIGLRMALGASRRDVVKMVLGQTVMLAIAGIGIGTLAAFLATRLIASLLYGVSATDPWSLTIAAGAMASITVLAAYLPTRRALRIDPMTALRCE